MSTEGSILAVIIIYETDVVTCESYKTLEESAKDCDTSIDLVIYDNSKNPYHKLHLLNSDFFKVHYYHNPANGGVSAGYNYASRIAHEHQWLLLLDQDTSFPSNSLAKYIEGILTAGNAINLIVPILDSGHGYYSPFKLIFGKGVIWKSVMPGVYSLDNKGVLNSGILVKNSAFAAVGGYNEKVKLYFSDIDFIRRFRQNFNSMLVLNLICHHDLSDISRVDEPTALRRFKTYCEGGFFASENDKWFRFQISVTIFLRSILLTYRYRTIKFLVKYFGVLYNTC